MKKKTILILFVALFIIVLFTVPAGAEPLMRGSGGEQVTRLQQWLTQAGYDTGGIDGNFGDGTENAILQYQSDHGLQPTGMLDKETYDTLIVPEKEDPDKIHGYGYFSGKYTWEEAEKIARDMGGYLVNINTQAEYNEIQSEILELDMTDTSFWIGARKGRKYWCQPENFYWSDDAGIQIDAIDNSAFDGIDPWALTEPSFRNEFGETEEYVQMAYDPDEARWIWTNTTEQEQPQGYIVEFPDGASYASHSAGSPDPSIIATSGTDIAPVSENQEYGIYDIKVEDYTIKLTYSAPESCLSVYRIYPAEGGESLFSFADPTFKSDGSTVTRAVIPEEFQSLVPDNFTISAELYMDYTDQDGNDSFEFFTEPFVSYEYTTWNIPPVPETEEPIQDPVIRTTFVLESDPVRKDSQMSVEIYDKENETLQAVTSIGQSIYLPAGAYFAVLPAEKELRADFDVFESPVMVTFIDQERASYDEVLLDSETQEPLEGMDAVLIAQGRQYQTVSNADGKIHFDDIPPYDVLLRISDFKEEYENINERITLEPGKPTLKTRKIPVREYTAFFGYLRGDQATYDREAAAFHARQLSGYYGSPYGNYWMILYPAYFSVEELIPITSYKITQKQSSIQDGDLLNMGWEPNLAEKEERSFRQTYEDIMEFIPFRFDGIKSELIVVSGYVHENRMEANNPHFDDWFNGWSDMALDMEVWGTPKQIYHEILLKNIDNGKNAMKDDIFRAILKKHYQDSNLEEAQINIILAALEKALPKYRDLYLLSLYHYNISANEDGDNSLYTMSDNTLHMKKNDNFRFSSTFFHESGHALQQALWDNTQPTVEEIWAHYEEEATVYISLENDVGNHIWNILDDLSAESDNPLTDAQKDEITSAFISSDKNMPNNIKEDQQLKEYYNKAKKIVEEETHKVPGNNASMVRDIYGGFTNNKISPGFFADNGHPTDYWFENNASTYAQMKEGWAEYFSANIQQDAYNIKKNKEFFPESTDKGGALENLLDVLYNDYLNQCREQYELEPDMME